jgi:hypothetical protein
LQPAFGTADHGDQLNKIKPNSHIAITYRIYLEGIK